MIRGVFFKISQTMNNVILWPILECIDVEKYNWYNIESQCEVWADSQGSDFFKLKYYDGKNFSKHIRSRHFIVFLKLQAYFETGEFGDIHTYEEFLACSCQILLLINDCEFVEIYAKDQKVIKTLFENALAHNYKEVEYITDINDGRTRMDVL